MRRVVTWLGFALLWVGSVRPASAASRPGDPTAEAFRRDVSVLASDAMEGRGVGTAGLGKAANWIEARLRALELRPGFADGYRQRFPIKTGVRLRTAADGSTANRLDGVDAADWVPLGFSDSGAFAGELAFAGYGIEAPDIGYRELSGLDLAGKVVLMLRYEPQEKDEASPFDGRRPSRWSALRYKVLQARERGAAAVVFVTGPVQDDGQDKVPALKNDGPESLAGLPVLQVRLSVAQRWLSAAGIDLARFQKDVDRDLRPRSLDHTGVRLSGCLDLEATWAQADNLLGLIPGRGRLKDEVVVLGAHYDHLGYGGAHSMRPNEHAIHNGADDNASGTVAVLLAAERLGSELKPAADRRTVAVALFSGEEVGLAGSSFLVDHAPFALDAVEAMVNLDMVGRLRDDTLIALGADTAPEWKPEIARLAERLGLKVTARGDGYGPSDQTAFYAKGRPVLHLFTGTHEQYHTPDDKPDTLDPAGAARVVAFTTAVVLDMARGSLSPQFARATTAPPQAGDSRGYGAWLGTVPDYRAMESSEGGVLLSDVRAGGPAERAGIKGGDRIVEMADTRIANLYDMTYALQDHRPGQTVDVVVLREGERLTLRATLGDRSAVQQAPALAAPTPEKPVDKPAADPHAAAPPPARASASDFYRDRPGAGFAVEAGKPFGRTFEGERHLAEIRQLTFGGENAEAYWSPDGRKLILQSTPRGAKCDQEFVIDLGTGETTRVSSGKGRTTCGYFRSPQMDRIVYASTELAGDACPAPPDMSQGYVWAVYDSYDLWQADPDGKNARRLTDTPGYDAEATWCGRGGKVVFTSVRDGDLDLYEMDEAGHTRRLTDTPGYDGGAFYSPDCSEIVWRASRPQGVERDEYRTLLKAALVRPRALEIMLMKADGSGAHALTHNGAANFCPTFLSDGRRIIWASNVGSSNGREFDLWMMDKEGGEPERVTSAEGFDGFPHFSPDGLYLVWGSNRADPQSHETNIFLARWVE